MVREDPDHAYEPEFYERFATERDGIPAADDAAQPQVALPLARVMVMWPIVVSALAPCQWRSPALT